LASESQNIDYMYNDYTWMISPSQGLLEKENRSSFNSTVVYHIDTGQLRRGEYSRKFLKNKFL